MNLRLRGINGGPELKTENKNLDFVVLINIENLKFIH